MKVRVIINPSSGRQTVQKQAKQIIDKLVQDKTFRQVDIIQTTGAGDAFEAARDFQPWQTDLVMAVGGDGTVNEVVNGLMAGRHLQTPLTILPAGTVNDFAYSMDIPRETDAYCAMLRSFKTRRVDVGRAGDKFFLNVAAGGVLTDVAYKTPSEAKTVLGQLAYLINGAIDLPGQLWQTISIDLISNQKSISEEVMLFIISNTKSVGGFRSLAPDAKVDDGLLDVLVVHKMNWYDFLPLMVKLMNGEHISHKGISYFQTDKLKIICKDACNVPLDLDGEEGGNLPVEISVKKQAIPLIIP